tara:strand:+ start:628 stop:1881 length:1254 start_codon:yes stop_codon:yes gene_type:complete
MLLAFLNKNFKIILLLSILLIVFYRSPYIFLNGRFVAEEGQFFFRNSFLNGPFIGLTQIMWSSPYINFWANISSVFASFLPLEYAPLGTVYMAFIVQLYLFIFIIFGESLLIINKKDKIIISLLVLIAPPMVASVWLNTLTSQVYFTVLTVLIFFQKDIKNNLFNKLSPFILLISGLTSILPCVFFPFFYLRYFRNKSQFNLINLISLLIPTTLQSILFVFVKINNLELYLDGPRYILSFGKLINYFYNVVIKSFFGRDLTQVFFFKFFDLTNLPILLFFISLIILIFLKINYKKIKDDKILRTLFLFFIIQSALVIYAAKFESVQGRYAVVPGILLLFFIYRMYQITDKWNKNLCAILIFFSLITGGYEFKMNNKYTQFLTCINCPVWKEELDKWKLNKDYEIKIWNYPGKTMKLN